MPKDNKKSTQKKSKNINETLLDENMHEVKELLEKITKLEKELTDQQEITKRAQSDLVRQKLDFDAYTSRAEEAKKTSEVDGLLKVAGKILPFVNQLKTTVDMTPTELSENAWVQGVQLIYTKAINDMEQIGIKPIEVVL